MVNRAHQALIAKLFPDDPISQRMAANFVERYAPAIGDRVDGLLAEAVVVNARVQAGEITADQGRSFLASFAKDGMGVLGATVDDGLNFLEGGAGLTAEDLAAAETAAAEPAEAPRAPAQPQPAQTQPAQARPATAAAPAPQEPLLDREALRKVMILQESNMRAEPGSAAWKAYWKEGGAQEYRAALDGLQASTDAMARLAGGTSAPARPAAAPAPAPTGPTPGA
jgi:hypothetical protein